MSLKKENATWVNNRQTSLGLGWSIMWHFVALIFSTCLPILERKRSMLNTGE